MSSDIPFYVVGEWRISLRGLLMPELVLTRRPEESIMIGDDIKITVMRVKGKQVRLGIEAKLGTPIYREEVYLRLQKEKALEADATAT
jgi:carbon storage regulator